MTVQYQQNLKSKTGASRSSGTKRVKNLGTSWLKGPLAQRSPEVKASWVRCRVKAPGTAWLKGPSDATEPRGKGLLGKRGLREFQMLGSTRPIELWWQSSGSIVYELRNYWTIELRVQVRQTLNFGTQVQEFKLVGIRVELCQRQRYKFGLNSNYQTQGSRVRWFVNYWTLGKKGATESHFELLFKLIYITHFLLFHLFIKIQEGA